MAVTPAGAVSGQTRGQSAGMRWLLIVSGVLVLLAGIQLFVLTEHTDVAFAWTVHPPLSAAFLGAGYFGAVAMEWLAARERVWVSARLVAVTIVVFASLTLVATLLHLELFHFDAPAVGTVTVTWAWMAIYVGVPPLMALLAAAQRRMPGTDPPRLAPMASWFKAVFGVHMLVMLALGAAMFVAPVATGDAAWPWELTPLTGRAIAAWLLGMAFAGFFAIWEDDWARLRPVMTSLVILVVAQLVALGRYVGTLDWTGLRSWVYAGFLLTMLVLGVIALRETRAKPRPAI